MGTHHGGNGGGDVPPEGDRPPDPDLPELPPEWGEVPDDPSELAAEAAAIRAELAQERISDRPGPTVPDEGRDGDAQPSVAAPLLIMAVAVVITLVSLFAMAWSSTGSLTGDREGPEPAGASGLPPLSLSDHAGRQVALQAQTPMALLLVEECDCQHLIAATAAAAPASVRVVTVGHSPPPAPGGLAPDDPQPLRLADPSGELRAQLDLGTPTDTATVLLVDGEGQIRHTVPAATSVAQFQGDLTDLT